MFLSSKLFLAATLLAAANIRGAEIWQEGEKPTSSNWSGETVLVMPDGSGASSGLAHRLFTSATPPGAGFQALYKVTLPQDGRYTLWAAMSAPNVSWASTPEIRVDGATGIDREKLKWATPSFGGEFPNRVLGWVNAGVFDLKAGEHEISFTIREKRRDDGQYICFLDGFLLTTDANLKPTGNYKISSQQPEWAEQVKAAGGFREFKTQLEKEQLRLQTERGAKNEGMTEANFALALSRLKARPLPDPAGRNPGLHKIGVHGMEAPFVRVGKNPETAAIAFELLARAGVDSLRTAELCWHRLGGGPPDQLNFREIDFQVEQAQKYGMNFMFTIGYPPAKFTVGDSVLSTFKPEYEEMFREYLRIILPKYDRYAQYWEYGNEVDAPDTWFRKASAADYVRDCRIVREEMTKLGIRTPLMGISATYSRDDSRNHRGGRTFTNDCLKAGIDQYVDGFTIHYTWPLSQRDFVAYFRSLAPEGASKRLSNSEESGYHHPSDVIKLLARDLYLYDLESVYYYLSQDWVEAGNALFSGLFSADWQPKLRLLSLAAGADAMKTRELVAMAEPVPGIEAYLLETPAAPAGEEPRYAIVLWRSGFNEEIGNRFTPQTAPPPVTVRLPAGSVSQAVDWMLGAIPFDSAAPEFAIDGRPVILYVTALPPWPRLTPEEWLMRHGESATRGADAIQPGQ